MEYKIKVGDYVRGRRTGNIYRVATIIKGTITESKFIRAEYIKLSSRYQAAVNRYAHLYNGDYTKLTKTKLTELMYDM